MKYPASWMLIFVMSIVSVPLHSAVAENPTNSEARPKRLFNGIDLTGWKAEGGARWEVVDGLLIGRESGN